MCALLTNKKCVVLNGNRAVFDDLDGPIIGHIISGPVDGRISTKL